MSIIDERTAAISDYRSAQERAARKGVRQGLWVGRGALVICGAAAGSALAEVTVNFDVITSSGYLMLIVAALFGALVFAAVETARVTTRAHRAGVRRAAHVIAGTRRFQRRALAITSDSTPAS